MPVNIIAYPPGGGGNHLKNLAELGGNFADQWPWDWVKEQRVGLEPYDLPLGMPGEVHSLPGRNMHDVFVDHINDNQDGLYLLHGHFGELAPYAAAIRTWSHVRWLLVTMDDPLDRDLLRARQRRLDYHPYWLDEEQIFLYRPAMYEWYFGADQSHITLLSIRQIWHRDVVSSMMLVTLESAFDIVIDAALAQKLQDKWCNLNFENEQV